MSMMLRRGMMVPKAESGLPAEYLAVQYLESTGTQYINMLPDGYSVSTYVAGYLDLVITEKNSGTEYGLFGGKPNGSTPAPVLSLPSSSTKFSLWCNESTMWNSDYDAVVGTRYTVDAYWYLDNSRKITVNGSTQTVTGKNNSAISTNPNSMKLCLFKDGIRATSAGSTYFSKMRVYSAKVDVDGTIIRDLIPCIRISDSKPGMYDLVGRQFYTNAGTGEFLYPAMLKIAETGAYLNRSAEGTASDSAWCYTDWYLFDPQHAGNIKIRNNSTNSQHTYQYQDEDGSNKGYWYENQTFGYSGVALYKIRFSVKIADVDDVYAYCLTTGQIFFAGKNTQYFGYSNINNIPT